MKEICSAYDGLIEELELHFSEIVLVTLPYIPRNVSFNVGIDEFNAHISNVGDAKSLIVLSLAKELLEGNKDVFEK